MLVNTIGQYATREEGYESLKDMYDNITSKLTKMGLIVTTGFEEGFGCREREDGFLCSFAPNYTYADLETEDWELLLQLQNSLR